MYKLDECQSLNSDTSENIPIKFDNGRRQANAVGTKLIAFHTGLLQHPLYRKQTKICVTLKKMVIFQE